MLPAVGACRYVSSYAKSLQDLQGLLLKVLSTSIVSVCVAVASSLAGLLGAPPMGTLSQDYGSK